MDTITSPAASRSHAWQFFRSGGFDQVRIDSADDLRHLDSLDQKLWAVLACPVQGLEFDERTLALLDGRGEGRVLAADVLAAVRWACRVLRDPQLLFGPGDTVPLAALQESDADGATLLRTAREVLQAHGRPDAAEVALPDVLDAPGMFSPDRLNGDGVVTPALAADADTAAAITLVGDTLGTVADRSGEPGIDRALLDRFITDAAAVSAWRAQTRDDPAILALGEGTAQAVAAVEAVRAKVEDYYTRCRLAAFDARAAGALNAGDETWAALAVQGELSDAHEQVAALPLAAVTPQSQLPLSRALNPAWEDRVAALRRDAVEPLLGPREVLTRADWETLTARLDAWLAWQTGRPDTPVADVAPDVLQSFAEADMAGRIGALIEADEASGAIADRLQALERLLRYRQHLTTLLRNFINLADFYAPGGRAIFQAGTLYLDQRSCDLCLRVNDLGRHATLAPLSGTYLVYCQCTRQGEEPVTIVAAMTGGGADDMMVVGRNGLFYDRAGRDWSASVVRIVTNPISVREAFWSPYKRIARWVGEQMQKFATAQNKKVEDKASAALTEVGSQSLKPVPPPAAAPAKPASPGRPAGTTAAPAAPRPAPAAVAAPAAAAAPQGGFDIAKYAGIFAAVGLALGALGTAVATLLTAFLRLPLWEMPLVIFGLMLLVSGPSMLLAWLKLRRRNLGPLLDANGWAVNIRARINLPFGATLTRVASLPPGSRRSLVDPYADKPGLLRQWGPWIAVAVVAAAVALWKAGWIG